MEEVRIGSGESTTEKGVWGVEQRPGVCRQV